MEEMMDIIKCSNCGHEIQINDAQSLLLLTNIIKDTNEKVKCCDRPDYAPLYFQRK